MRNYLLLAVALVAALLAFVITKVQIQKEYRRLNLLAKKIKVVVAKRDLLKGDVVEQDDLTLRAIFASSASGDEIELVDVSQIYGQELLVDKEKDAHLRWTDFRLPTLGFAGSPLARTVKKGERALSLSVDSVSSVSGMVRPNDHVDIVGTFRFPGGEEAPAMDAVTLTILQNVTVLAVGQEVASSYGQQQGGGRSRSYATVTLAVTPKEAEMLVFAQSKGALTLTLRNPADPYIEQDIQDVNFDYLKTNSGKYTEDRRKRLELELAPRDRL